MCRYTTLCYETTSTLFMLSLEHEKPYSLPVIAACEGGPLSAEARGPAMTSVMAWLKWFTLCIFQ